MIFGPRLCSCF